MITTHVLDIANGLPAAGVPVSLEVRFPDGAWKLLGRGSTNEDGRAGNLLPEGVKLTEGVYRLTFDTRAHQPDGLYPGGGDRLRSARSRPPLSHSPAAEPQRIHYLSRNLTMPVVLDRNSYGKSRVRLVKVTRRQDRHDLTELTVDVRFEGDFDAVHTRGDNRNVLPTDTMKNTVYALAKAWNGVEIEDFGRKLAEHFLAGNPQVARVTIAIAQSQWIRIGRHAFTRGAEEKRITRVSGARSGLETQSGIDNLVALKTTGSSFEGYKKDRYTTLKETSDRILATAIRAEWSYQAVPIAFGARWSQAREVMLKVFAGQDSPSVQQTAYAMGEAVLEAVPEIDAIRLSLPNKHCLLVDLSPFGIENQNEIFTPTDEPHGLIEVSLRRVE